MMPPVFRSAAAVAAAVVAAVVTAAAAAVAAEEAAAVAAAGEQDDQNDDEPEAAIISTHSFMTLSPHPDLVVSVFAAYAVRCCCETVCGRIRRKAQMTPAPKLHLCHIMRLFGGL